MRLVCGENSVSIIEETLELYTAETKIYEVNIRELLWYSVKYPWEFKIWDWKLLGRISGKNSIEFRYKHENILASICFLSEFQELKLHVNFTNLLMSKVNSFTAGISIPLINHGKNKITIPHLIYNDNPSAEKERVVAHIGETPGEGIIVEEHRLPVPAVNVEWKQENSFPFLTLLSLPQVVDGEEEEYWSLGVLKEEKGDRITALSGPLMFNGMKDVVYAGRCTPLSHRKGYRTLAKGETISKSYYLSWGQLEEEGKAFRNIIDVGYRILQPHTVPRHSYEEMITFKKEVLDSRYYKDESCVGYQTFGAVNSFGNISGRPEFFLYGWTGQSIKLAWCDCMLGLMTQEKFRFERAIEIVHFFVTHGQSNIKGLYKGYYVIDDKSFRGDWKDPEAGLSSRIQGESISDLIEIMILLRKHGREVPRSWEIAVKEALDFLMNETYQIEGGIYPFQWQLDGSIVKKDINASGMPCILALAKASEYFHKKEYLEYAEKKYEIYAHYHMDTFDIPFAKATMDARCEDKEAGIYFFETAARLYKITKKEKFRKWAEIAADWILTFVFFWETGFQKGSPCDVNEFKTTGWPGVSVQNHHLDVFFPAYEMYSFGKLCDNKRLMEMAMHVRNALTHGVCTKEGEWGYTLVGEQGEHYYHTNYFQVTYPLLLKYLKNFRGGMQVWNPSWITAQVLECNLKFNYIEQNSNEKITRES